jgi:hypothetical protein
VILGVWKELEGERQKLGEVVSWQGLVVVLVVVVVVVAPY